MIVYCVGGPADRQKKRTDRLQFEIPVMRDPANTAICDPSAKIHLVYRTVTYRVHRLALGDGGEIRVAAPGTPDSAIRQVFEAYCSP